MQEKEQIRRYELFQSFFDSFPEALLVCTQDGTVLDCNQVMKDRAYRLNKEDFVGKNIFISLKKNDRAIFRTKLKETFSRGAIRNLETIWNLDDGRTVNLEISVSVLKNLKDEAGYFIALVRNITDKKLLEEELISSKKELELKVRKRTAELEASNYNLNGVITEIVAKERELQANYKRQKITSYLSSAISRATKIDDIYFAAFLTAAEGLGASGSGILLKGPGNEFELRASKGLPEKLGPDLEFLKEEPDRRAPRLIPTEGISNAEVRNIMRNSGTALFCVCPLMQKGRVTGKFLLTFSSKNGLSDSEMDLLNIICDQLAFSIERRLAEKALIQSEESYRGLFNSITDAIIIIGPHGRIIDLNQGAASLWGYNPEDLKGQDLGLICKKYDPEELNTIDLIRFNDSGQYFECLGIRNDGRVLPLDARLSPGSYFGQDILLLLARDISHIKEVEFELLRAKERAEQSDRLKSEFLAQMSHEIRTPVNTILNFSSLIENSLEGKLTGDLSEGFSIIEKGGQRLIRTVDSILNMSQIQTGSIEIKPKRILLEKDVLHPLIREFARAAKKKSISISFYNEINGCYLKADQYCVTQIFSQILDNAVKYTQEGSIEIKEYSGREGFVSVSITDTGIGISKEYLPNLFTAFSQEETGYTRKFEGNGLGLALVKKYTELNQGSISVESQKGKGSKFTICFPIEKD